MAKRKRKKQVRTRSSGRQHRKQRLRKSILIVCEGKKTEPLYLDALCSDRLDYLEVFRVQGGQFQRAPIRLVFRPRAFQA